MESVGKTSESCYIKTECITIKDDPEDVAKLSEEATDVREFEDNNVVIGDGFIKSVERDLSVLTAPISLYESGNHAQFSTCGNCNRELESKLRTERHLEIILESLRNAQTENYGLKAALKETQTQLMNKDDEISRLKTELSNVKKTSSTMGNTPTVPNVQTKRHKGNLISAETCYMNPYSIPMNLTTTQNKNAVAQPLYRKQPHSNLPTHSSHPLPNTPATLINSQVQMHGIDGRRAQEGYFCICGMQFGYEPFLYRHLKTIITNSSSSTTTTVSSASYSSVSSSKSSNKVILCSICQEKFTDWSLFKTHTKEAHSISDLDEFEWRESSMAQIHYIQS